MLVEDLNRPFHHAGWFFLGTALFLQRFTLAGQTHLNGIARFNRLDKAQVFHAVVGNDRPNARINEQPCRGGNQEVAVHHALAKDRLCRADLVHMGVKVVAAQAGKIHDVRFRQGAARRQQAVARLQLLKVFAERMHAIFLHRCATHPLLADGGQHGWTALNRGALQVVLHRAQAAQLFATARTSGTAVH